MNGLDDEEYGEDDFRPVPHPDDRLWRHPAEIAAMNAAALNDAADLDDTVELFPSTVADDRSMPADTRPVGTPHRAHRGLLAAAVVVAVGASAIAMATFSTRTDQRSFSTLSAGQSLADTALVAEAPPQLSEADDLAIAADTDAEMALASRIHDEVAASLPRIQAATANGMREGSGLFVSPQGHLITSAGLVGGADYVIAWTADGRRWPATLVAKDALSDVAVLSINAETTVAAFSQDAHVWSGQYALAIDHSNRTMSLGEVESLIGISDGSHNAAQPVPQDPSSRIVVAPQVPPGSAIIDDTGSVIAMVNLATSDTTTATPAWMLERVVGQLVAGGSVHHTWFGAEIEPEPDASAAHITTVFRGSPAEAAGLRSGDIIDAVNGEPLSTNMSLWTMMQMRSPGDSVDLAITRHGERRLISVTLDAWIGD